MKKIIAALFVCLSVYSLTAAETDGTDFVFYDPPSKNPRPAGYLNETMDSISMEITSTELPGLMYIDVGFGAQMESWDTSQGGGRIVFIYGGMIPLQSFISLPVNLSIPFFFGYLFSESSDPTITDEDYVKVGSLIGVSGLTYSGRFGLITGLFGYAEGFYWGVFPLINAQEFPFLSLFIKLINGYFRTDIDMFRPEYKANILFKDFGIDIFGLDTRWSFSLFTQKNWFNIDTKYDLHAVKLDLSIPVIVNDNISMVYFSTTIGYRNFFDTTRNIGFYESGGYVRIAAGIQIAGEEYDGIGIQLSVESNVKSFFSGCNIGFYISARGFFFDNSKFALDSKFGRDGGDLGFYYKGYMYGDDF